MSEVPLMGWPTSQDYREAMQHPLRRFCKPELRRAQAAAGPDGKPLVHAGERVDVYEMRGSNGIDRWAIGCFLREAEGLARRYQLINEHLQQYPVPNLVETELLEQGICIRGRWYPITRCRWVDGLPLHAFVRDNVDEPTELRSLAISWIKLAQELRRAGMGHGNLSGDTVLVVPGKGLQLIDYDGVFVPALAESPPAEMGNGAFQHPQRIALQTYDTGIDRFAQLVIYTALQALASGGRDLWDRFEDGSSLLFRASDWKQPGNSALLKALWRSQDTTVRILVGQLILASQGNIGDVPLVEQVADTRTLNSAAVERIDSFLSEGVDLKLTIEDEEVDDLELVVDEDVSEEAITKPMSCLHGSPEDGPPPPVPDVLDIRTRTYDFDAWLPERIAVIKLQGFVRDIGGEIVLSAPGHIRVQMLDDTHLPQTHQPRLLAWLGLVQQPVTAAARVLAIVDLYLIHKPTVGRQMIGITVQLTPGSDQEPGDRWKPYCDRIFCELRAHLVGYQE
jgi:hypothetical protein